MKILLGFLGSIGLASSASVSLTTLQNNSTTNFITEPIQGTTITNLIAQERVEDSALGSSKKSIDDNSRTILWKEFNIDDLTYNKIDFENSIVGLDIKHGYGDNSGEGSSEGWTNYEEFNIERYFNTGEKEYNEDRHHGGGGRATDHQWKYSLEVNASGITIWDWVWVWANGNWGNSAQSEADINIRSIYFNFQLLG